MSFSRSRRDRNGRSRAVSTSTVPWSNAPETCGMRKSSVGRAMRCHPPKGGRSLHPARSTNGCGGIGSGSWFGCRAGRPKKMGRPCFISRIARSNSWVRFSRTRVSTPVELVFRRALFSRIRSLEDGPSIAKSQGWSLVGAWAGGVGAHMRVSGWTAVTSLEVQASIVRSGISVGNGSPFLLRRHNPMREDASLLHRGPSPPLRPTRAERGTRRVRPLAS